ncbi:hypothetical protein COU80_03740 [Candidatus Peregrinibacteria bacterium CG10_big_fil_rev_8_21_14_0_10_55_24]|nr:MAG: hypothetical protein COU80_03740 [Candidatus Peregrinibacteria bacterium CG10_big_fil_rev_8_21_14_0_10_55_24]
MQCRFPKSPMGIATVLLRLSFGLSLLFVGLVHYMTFQPFKGMAMEGLGALEPLGMVWAFVLPALMIIGGALLALGFYMEVGSWAAGIALASIPVGMLLKPVLSGVSLPSVMPSAIDAFIWLIVYYLVVKSCVCCTDNCCATEEE